MVTRETLNDLGLGLTLGLLVGLGPFTTSRLSASLVGGGAVAALVFGYRQFSRRRAGDRAEADERPLAGLALPPLSLCLALVLFLLLFLPTLQWLLAVSMASVWTNGHGLFTPFIMGYFALRTLRRFDGEEPESSAWGFLFLGLGVALMLLDLVPNTFYMAALGGILCLPGLSLLFFGVRRTRALTLPLALGFFLIPIPYVVGSHLYLQLISAAGTEPLLRLFGYPVVRQGTLLMLPTFTIEVTDACSGFSALYAAIFVGVILVAYSASPLRKIGMALAVVPVAMISNAIRVFSLVVLVDLTGVTVLESTLHPATGAVSFWVVILTLFMIAGRKTIRAVFA